MGRRALAARAPGAGVDVKAPPLAYRLAQLAYATKCRVLRPITAGVRVLVLRDREVLLVRHTYGSGWFMPGGGLKRGETLEEAARRELLEETGIVAAGLAVVGLFTHTGEGKTDHVVVFRARVTADHASKSGEIAECCWFPVDALPAGCSAATRRRILQLADEGAPLATGRW